jgi:hypothetical protein
MPNLQALARVRTVWVRQFSFDSRPTVNLRSVADNESSMRRREPDAELESLIRDTFRFAPYSRRNKWQARGRAPRDSGR